MLRRWLRWLATVVVVWYWLRTIDASFWCFQETLFFIQFGKSFGACKLMLFNLIFWFINNIDLFVRVLMVHIQDVLLPFVEKDFSDIVDVSSLRLFLDFDRNFWILGKDVSNEELLFKLHGHNIFTRHVNELTFFIKAHIIVTYIRELLQLNGNLKLVLTQSLSHKVVSNANFSFLDKVHMRNFIFFIKNQRIIDVIVVLKLSWNKTKANIVQELGVKVIKSIEEGSEFVNHIVKQVLEDKMLLYSSGTLVEKLVVLFYRFESVICPVERKVLVYLVY